MLRAPGVEDIMQKTKAAAVTDSGGRERAALATAQATGDPRVCPDATEAKGKRESGGV